MDWTLSITLFKQLLMCLMKPHSTTRRWGGGGSILIIKGGGGREREMLTEAQKLQAFAAKQPTSQRPAAAMKSAYTKHNNFTLCLCASGRHCWHRGSSRPEINHLSRAALSDSVTAAGYSAKVRTSLQQRHFWMHGPRRRFWSVKRSWIIYSSANTVGTLNNHLLWWTGSGECSKRAQETSRFFDALRSVTYLLVSSCM